jgi:hypothetical protein
MLGWQNRDVTVQVQIGHFGWTGHLWAVLVVGALLACWFLLGVAFIQCRLAERRRTRAARKAEPARHSRPIAVGGAALQR